MHVSFNNYQYKTGDADKLVLPIEVIQALWRHNWLDNRGKPVRKHPNGKYLSEILCSSRARISEKKSRSDRTHFERIKR